MNETSVVNLRKEPYDVYIGRGSKWGNKYTHLPLNLTQAAVQVATREEAIRRHREDFLADPQRVAECRRELTGKRLGCFCKPQSCHGDIYAEVCNEP